MAPSTKGAIAHEARWVPIGGYQLPMAARPLCQVMIWI
jgi:hypothetical protein